MEVSSFCITLTAGNTVSKHKRDYKLQKFLVVALLTLKPISYSPVSETKRTCRRQRSCFT